MTVQLNRAQKFVEAQVQSLFPSINNLLAGRSLARGDWELVAREVKKHVKRHYGMNEIMLILYGTRFTMQDVTDGQASSAAWDKVWWGGGRNPKFTHPRRHLRILAHSFLCAELVSFAAAGGLCRDEDLLSELWHERTYDREVELAER